ncbi:MAG: response regulator transcription factor [Agathobacter sp.]|nr:response regulator transcription factor [Agathobacter sp.]
MSNNKYKILVVEDETNICNLLETILTTNGYQVVIEGTCRDGITMMHSYVPDLVILDLGLPDKDGLEFIKTIRKNDTTPILVVSARSNENDKVLALDLGANDYITKPFGNAELMARVRAALRDRRSVEVEGIFDGKFHLYDMEIDYARRIVTIGGVEVKLTRTEYNILEVLSQNQGKVLTYAAIIRKIWGPADDGGTKKLQVNMANIRKKIGCIPGDNKYIINELGVGYRIGEEN